MWCALVPYHGHEVRTAFQIPRPASSLPWLACQHPEYLVTFSHPLPLLYVTLPFPRFAPQLKSNFRSGSGYFHYLGLSEETEEIADLIGWENPEFESVAKEKVNIIKRISTSYFLCLFIANQMTRPSSGIPSSENTRLFHLKFSPSYTCTRHSLHITQNIPTERASTSSRHQLSQNQTSLH